jgi:hypothetical protein
MDLDTRIIYFGIRAFNFCYDKGLFLKNAIKQGLSDLSAYIGGRYNEWHFLEGEVGPLPDSVVKNRSISNIEWSYNTNNYTLYMYARPSNLRIITSHLWLTASFRVGNIEYDANDFITRFQYISNTTFLPSRKVILCAWSIHSGIWFNQRDNPILRVITINGDQIDIPIFGEYNEWRRLITGDGSDSDNESETLSDSENIYESNSENMSDNEVDFNQEVEINRENLPASPENRNRIDSDNVELIEAPLSAT